MAGTPLHVSRRALDELLALACPEFPIVHSNDAPAQQRVASGLLARILGAAEAAAHLATIERRADLGVVCRSLYEHVVMLAWLTGKDAEDRIARWHADGDQQRLRLDREVGALTGEAMLTGENLAEIERSANAFGKGKPLPPLADRAAQADADWGERFRFAGSDEAASAMYSLRAAYSVLYRFASIAAHPTPAGLNFVMQPMETRTVTQLERRTDVGPTFGVATALVGTALYIASDVLGFPRAHEVSAVFDRFG